MSICLYLSLFSWMSSAIPTDIGKNPVSTRESQLKSQPLYRFDRQIRDGSKLPKVSDPPIQTRSTSQDRIIQPKKAILLGWSGEFLDPPVNDRRRRPAFSERPSDIGASIRPGERFRYDVLFSGNSAGQAEVHIVAQEPGPWGSPDQVLLQAFATTSGVVALLASFTYNIDSYVDAKTGLPIHSQAWVIRDGFSTTYKKRQIITNFLGSGGYAELSEQKDEKRNQQTKQMPVGTYDALSIMAWVRSLKLAKGEQARAYALDGFSLLRVDIVSQGRSRPSSVPAIAPALGIDVHQLEELTGTITPVDRYGHPIPGKRVHTMRAWISDDEKRIPLVLESNVWVGMIRLMLSQYDPPVSP